MVSFEGIKQGDKVLVCGGGFRGGMREGNVAKVTKLHFEVEGSKYRIKDGWLVGRDSYSTIHCELFDAARLEKHKQYVADQEKRVQVSRVEWANVPMDIINQIHALVIPPTDSSAA
jgi:ribosomal protein L24